MKKVIFIFVMFVFVHCILKIENCSAQWVQMSNGIGVYKTVNSFTSMGMNIFSGTNNGIFLSTNYGINWIQTSLNGKTILTFATSGPKVFAGTFNYGIYLSTNSGNTWHQTSFNDNIANALIFSGSNIFAGIEGIYPSFGGIYVSTNNGTNWSITGLQNYKVTSFTKNTSFYFAGTNYRVYASSNSGINWYSTSLEQNILALTERDNNIFAGTENRGIFLSTNNGMNWIQKSLLNEIIYYIAVSNVNIFVGTKNHGIYFSTNNGDNWIQKNQGLGNLTVKSIYIINDFIFAGTENGVWRRNLSEIIGINQISEVIPSLFSLSQNYPNPFNSISKIKMQISKSSETKLIIYDILGKEVETLINEKLQSGTYEVNWDASQYPSGVYFYRLQAGDFVDIKRMMLVK